MSSHKYRHGKRSPATAAWLSFAVLAFGVAVLFPQAPPKEPAQPPAARAPGVLLTGYAQNEKFSKFYPYFYEELKNYISSRGVPLTQPGEVGLQSDPVDLDSVLDRLPELKVRGLVYFRFDANEVGWIWLTVQCFDSVGKLLWEEKANSLWSGAMTPSGCARAAVSRIQGKLKGHIGKPGMPLRDSLTVPSPKSKSKGGK